MITDLDKDCLFCQLANEKTSPLGIYEDDMVVAFLDIGPIREGHVQVMPRAHYTYFDDLPTAVHTRIMMVAQKIAKAQKRLYSVERVAFLFTGGDIPHAHAHLVPMVEKTDITSRQYIADEDITFRPVPTPPIDELKLVAEKLIAALI